MLHFFTETPLLPLAPFTSPLTTGANCALPEVTPANSVTCCAEPLVLTRRACAALLPAGVTVPCTLPVSRLTGPVVMPNAPAIQESKRSAHTLPTEAFPSVPEVKDVTAQLFNGAVDPAAEGWPVPCRDTTGHEYWFC